MLEETFVLGALVSCSCAGASARGHPCTGPPESRRHSAALLLGAWQFVPLCRALGAGAGCAVLDSLSYLLHNLDIPSGPVCRRLAGVQPGRWGHHSVMAPVFLGGSGSNARAQEARPAPVYRFHPHFLVQSDVNLSLEKGGPCVQ